jgi:hypothetical protein
MESLCKLNRPLSEAGNPFLFKEIKLLDTEIFTIVNKTITLNKIDIIYAIANDDAININGTINKNIKNINKQISNNNDIKLIFEHKLLPPATALPFNLNDANMVDELIRKYKNEYRRVGIIKLNFIKHYIDATNLKNAHLNNNCKKRKNTTSKCNIANFLIPIKDTKTVESIKEEYYNILRANNITNIVIKDCNIGCCFIINKMYNLFNDYLITLMYCIKLIKEKPYVILNKSFLFEIKEENHYFYEDDNSININHMNKIFNISIETNDEIQTSTHVRFLKTPTRNDVYFI